MSEFLLCFCIDITRRKSFDFASKIYKDITSTCTRNFAITCHCKLSSLNSIISWLIWKFFRVVMGSTIYLPFWKLSSDFCMYRDQLAIFPLKNAKRPRFSRTKYISGSVTFAVYSWHLFSSFWHPLKLIISWCSLHNC